MSSNNPIALARALTKRTKREGVAAFPSRDGSVRYAPGTIKRGLISLPTELLSTTNVHALNAPDIRSVSTSSSASSLRSADDSDFSHIDRSFIDTPMTTPDISSEESSPVFPDGTQQKSFFESHSPKRSTTSAGTIRSSSSTSSLDAPAIPQRALSHSKRAHQDLARKRSISRMSPPPSSLPAANVVRNSRDIFGTVEANHPFGKELAKVNEVAEEFRGVSTIMDEEERFLLSQGLQKFGVEDYINEIQGLYGGVFEDHLGPTAWI